MPKIKICGLQDTNLAYACAKAGADYIGLVFSENSKRKLNLDQAVAIAKSVYQGGAIPIAIFDDHNADEMQSICKATAIQYAQLHGELSRQEHIKLAEDIKRIYVLDVDKQGIVINDIDKFLKPERDFVLFDNLSRGNGKLINIKNSLTGFRTFIAGGLNASNVTPVIEQYQPYAVDVSSSVENTSGLKDMAKIQEFIMAVKNRRFGRFGGLFLPELLIAPVNELADFFQDIKTDEDFKAELTVLLQQYAGRATPLTEVKRFQAACAGPRLFLKREDLLHTGAHKINNALGQCLLAKKMHKKRIIAETGAGQHGVATATACAHLGLQCTIYMGATDMQRQRPNVEKMKLLGAEVVSVEQGSKTLKDAVNATLRDWAESFATTHYCLGSALGPYPYPQMVAFFQAVIGEETKRQCLDQMGKLPDLVIACVGGGSNAIGIFAEFLDDKVQLVGVEAGGKGTHLGEHAARFKGGEPGILHGCFSYLLQNAAGQVVDTHSISAGLDYPMIGPEHAHLHETKRVNYTSVTDEEALHAFKLLSKTEGIIPALESSHALAYYIKIAKDLPAEANVVINLSGRGDKDLPQLLSRGLV